MAERLLTVEEVADQWRCHPKTVLRAIGRGELEAAPVGEKGAYRIRQEWADNYVALKAERNRARRPQPVQAAPSRRGTLRPPGPRGRLVA